MGEVRRRSSSFADVAVGPSLRASVQGKLYALTPPPRIWKPAGAADGADADTGAASAGARWQWALLGAHNEASPVDLKGLTAAEAKGGRLTVWYEEAQADRASGGAERPVDVPYSGMVFGLHQRDGLSVVFDNAFDADGKPERIHIANEDDWMWGIRRTKPTAIKLEPQMPAAANGREQHMIAMLM